jgi:fumarate hydratase, class II
VTDTDTHAPKILDLPIGLDATGMRKKFDSLGQVEVPADRYWGAQTQRSLEHFDIGHDLTLKQAALAKGVSEDLYDEVVIPLALTRPGTADLPAQKGY